MVTIGDIAKMTGVSVSTVSRVINGYPDVNDDTRRKVQEAIAELGYSPGALSRGRDKSKAMAIGIFYFAGQHGDLRNPYFPAVLDAFKRQVGEAGYDILFFAVNTPTSDVDSFAHRARLRHVDGLLLVSISRGDPRTVELTTSQIPSMSIDFDLIGPRAGYVCSDNLQGAVDAVEHLVSVGHTDIAFVADKFNTKPGHDRLIGYQTTLGAHGLPFRPDWILDGDFSLEGGYRATRMLLESEDRPTAIFCAGDLMAVGAMQAVRDAGLEVGSDVSIVGFDDIEIASLVTPGLTTVRQDRDAIGRTAAAGLVEMIQNPRSMPSVVTVPTELIIRDSVGPPRAR